MVDKLMTMNCRYNMVVYVDKVFFISTRLFQPQNTWCFGMRMISLLLAYLANEEKHTPVQTD